MMIDQVLDWFSSCLMEAWFHNKRAGAYHASASDMAEHGMLASCFSIFLVPGGVIAMLCCGC